MAITHLLTITSSVIFYSLQSLFFSASSHFVPNDPISKLKVHSYLYAKKDDDELRGHYYYYGGNAKGRNNVGSYINFAKEFTN